MPWFPERPAAAARGALGSFRRALPEGGALPVEEWRRRHRALLAVLWLNVAVLPAYGLLKGYGEEHDLVHAAALLPFALLAGSARLGPKVRSAFVSVGLLSAAALLVHLTGGLIEAHFYFFVLIVALTLYEDWLPFLLAVAYVLVHHGVVGTLEPHEVYNRPEAWAAPWTWAGVHAFFVALAGVAGVVAWRLNENVRNRMRRAQHELAEISETDSLTGLANRRKAMADLSAVFEQAAPSENLVVIFDLDGFKAYNDTFGHPAGDALLTRLAQRLQAAVAGRATAYRLGGDEFCLLGPGSSAHRSGLEAVASAALSESGEAFTISASHGSVLLPLEAQTPSDAMQLADQRMYARKNSSRRSAMRQSKDVLLQALAERHPQMDGHVGQVGQLAALVGRRLGMSVEETQRVSHAAELHDIGKVAIPDEIINKPGRLDEAEWEFIRRHTVIGQRIVDAAPALGNLAGLIRSSHERWEGYGYPDGLKGEEIPLGARIICACDAYDAMTSDRPYRLASSSGEALEELRRCAGTQFDPAVVHALEAVISAGDGRGKLGTTRADRSRVGMSVSAG